MEHALDPSVTNYYITGTVALFGFFSFLAMLGFLAWRWSDGFWGAILLSFNMAFATIIAINFYEPIGKAIASAVPVGLFYWDSLIFILLFLITLTIFTIITDKLSRVIVKFPDWVEMGVKPVFLLFIWFAQIMAVVCFVIQIGPTAPKPIGGMVDYEAGRNVADRFLRDSAQISSAGALCPLTGVNKFDSGSDFLVREYKRRCALLKILWETGSSRNGEKADFLE
jgi:hypothetical protein